MGEEGKLPNTLYEATIPLTPKPDKNEAKKELQVNNTDKNRCKKSLTKS